MQTDILGRGAEQGRTLFDGWYERLTASAAAGEGAAYVFVMGSLCEILRTFDIPVVFPEINSLQTAVKKAAGEYLNEAEDHGFSPDVCGYVKADYALQLRGGTHPRGRIPQPKVALLTNACNTYLKWAEIWERMYGTPTLTVDVPGSRAGSRPERDVAGGFLRDRQYVEHQVRELIVRLEEITGTKFDIDRLRTTLELTNRMGRAYRELLELNRGTPGVFDAVLEGTTYLGVANALRGTEEGARYFEDLVEEMRMRRALTLGPGGTAPQERHRLIFVGVPCYPIFSRFCRLFSGWDGVFVSSTYLWFASGGLDIDFEYDLRDPVASLAEGLLRGVRSAVDDMLFHDQALIRAIDMYGADGVVYHPVKSCRTVSTGLADSRRAVLATRDVLALYIESDIMDQRVVSEAQLKNRIDAFFEGLESRKLRTAGAVAVPA
ncbi:MAG TPA: 2-hydroxyacyl-CoA dehydratase family protein [Longimicrobiales bacterium]|nr:2-hydroxyacyl-CoA dehydratase family protein [Longimicrobiales bacterium]